MVTERFPQPPMELERQGALYDYLYRLAEQLNLLLDDLPTSGETAPAAAESPLSARQTRALVQRAVDGLSAGMTLTGDLTCAGAALTGDLTVGGDAAITGDATVTGTLSLTGDTALTLGSETLAQYVQRMIAGT